MDHIISARLPDLVIVNKKSEWSKLAQKKYKSRHNWMGEMIH